MERLVGARHLELDDDHVIREQIAQPLFDEALAQRLGITRDLFRTGGRGVFGKDNGSKQFVLRGDDVFGFGAGLGFLQRERVDQDALIGNRGGAAL